MIFRQGSSESVEISTDGKRRVIEALSARHPTPMPRARLVSEVLQVFPRKNPTQASQYLTWAICDLNHAFHDRRWNLRIIRRLGDPAKAHFFTAPIRSK